MITNAIERLLAVLDWAFLALTDLARVLNRPGTPTHPGKGETPA